MERLVRGDTSRRVSPLALPSPLPSDGLEERMSRCGLGEDRKPGVRRGDPLKPDFMGDRATGGGRKDARPPFVPLKKSAGPSPLPVTRRKISMVADKSEEVNHTPSSMDIPSDPIVVLLPYASGDFSGDEKIPSISSIPCSSRLPSLKVTPVRLHPVPWSGFPCRNDGGFLRRHAPALLTSQLYRR
jgi:hypothetical protein